MRKELEKIQNLLLSCEWEPTEKPADEPMSLFVKPLRSEGTTLLIEVALSPEALRCYGFYGVCSVQIEKYYAPTPYLRDDLKDMLEAISKTERELVREGIPFRPTYAFTDCPEYYLGENLRIRDALNLAAFEKEDR